MISGEMKSFRDFSGSEISINILGFFCMIVGLNNSLNNLESSWGLLTNGFPSWDLGLPFKSHMDLLELQDLGVVVKSF